MPEYKSSFFSKTSTSESIKNATQEMSQLLAPAIEKAHQLKYTSFQLLTQLEISQTNTTYFTLSKFALAKPYTSPAPDFSFPNVFAPIIADPESAANQGTVFLANEKDHIIIKDKYPAAPIHYLAIPKKDTITLLEMPSSEVAKLFVHAIDAALHILKLRQARFLINVAPPNQEVPHVHLHIMSKDKK